MLIRFIGKRLMMMVPVLLGVALFVFSMLYFSPGRQADYMLGDMATEEDKVQFEQQHGLDRPFLIQFGSYINGILHGDLGTSYISKRPVFGELLVRYPNTIKLSIMCTAFATIFGVILGVISATKQYSITDNVVRFVSIIGVSTPNFWQGLMLIIVFSLWLGWLPATGFSSWKNYILPVITIGTSASANIVRMTRSSMLETVRQDYIRTARAKGQTETVVIWKHALQNALIPIITTVGLTFGKMLGGMAIGESIFAIPGVGKLIVDAIPVKNAPVVQGGILFIALISSIVNLSTDVVYAYADPRIRSQYVRKKDRRKTKKRRPTHENIEG